MLRAPSLYTLSLLYYLVSVSETPVVSSEKSRKLAGLRVTDNLNAYPLQLWGLVGEREVKQLLQTELGGGGGAKPVRG